MRRVVGTHRIRRSVGRRARLGRLLSCSLAAVLTQFPLASPRAEEPEFLPGQVIVRWRGQAPLVAVLEQSSIVSRHRISNRSDVLDLGPQTRAGTLALVERLNGRDDVEFAQPNYVRRIAAVPNDPHYPLQWNLQTTGLEGAWDQTTGSEQIVVAIVDTGVRPDHPDLLGRLVPGYDFISVLNYANDGDGRDADPTDTGDNRGDSSAFHGLHVAGIVAASANNGRGIAGVDWKCRVLPVRAMGVIKGKGADADIAAAIRWSAGLVVDGAPTNQNPAKVINLSFAGPGESLILTEAVRAAINQGAIVVAAAGNQGEAVDNMYPAAIEGVITVGASRYDGSRAGYSNYGNAVDIMAPGGSINATLPFNHEDRSDWPAAIFSTMYFTGVSEYGYDSLQGTSQAAPVVAGVVALMASLDPSLSNTRAIRILTETANSDGRCELGCGSGLVDAAAAVRAATSTRPTSTASTPAGGIAADNDNTVWGNVGCALSAGRPTDQGVANWLWLLIALAGCRRRSRRFPA